MTISLSYQAVARPREHAGLKFRLRQLAAVASRLVGVSYHEISLVFVSAADIRRLNLRYRRHDRVTDILSFTYQVRPVIGELVVCWPQAVRQARRRGLAHRRELDVLLVHGLLHLVGYDHQRAAERATMRALEQNILTRVCVKR